jgi:hypothetical protein
MLLFSISHRSAFLEHSQRMLQVKPEIFNMMAPCMSDPKVGVCLAPQTFHNLIHPDWIDSANSDFNLAKMPYSFGAGNSFITGAQPPLFGISLHQSTPLQIALCIVRTVLPEAQRTL